MNTPICDFVAKYMDSAAARLHMPGHKGIKLLGFESYDITEFDGADSLFEADGIIKESEENASLIFGARTFYSAEGSSLCVRAMLYLALLYAKEKRKAERVLALRNAHKSFISAAALLDMDIDWLYADTDESYLSCKLSSEALEDHLSKTSEKPCALYVTSPDYLGNTLDIKSISRVCKKYGLLLLVDNAHGAYLKFLPKSEHPIDLGADMCCDSAHKTLPALTGAAYLHINRDAPETLYDNAKRAMALFASTSPSYLILESLDTVNKYLSQGYREKLAGLVSRLDALKAELESTGYVFAGNEPTKLAICAKKYGYTGDELAEMLFEKGIVCEFHDPDFVVFMLTPENSDSDILRLTNALLSIPCRESINTPAPVIRSAERVMSPRKALFSASEEVKIKESIGRVLADLTLSCPPAVPILVCGERIDADAAKAFEYYRADTVRVVK